MTSIIGPYADVENDYRREQISKSFQSHSNHRSTTGHRLFRRAPKQPAAPAIDWYGE